MPASGTRGPSSSTSARTSEWEQGHVTGALHVGKSYLEQDIEAAVPDRDAPVVLYCAGGIRSLFAGPDARRDGLHERRLDVRRLPAVEGARVSRGQAPRVLSDAQKQRYSRHLLIPEVGSEARRRLLDCEGPARRRRRSRLTGRALPRRGRRRHDRHRRLRRRRRQQPAAPDPPHDRAGRRAEGRVGQRRRSTRSIPK